MKLIDVRRLLLCLITVFCPYAVQAVNLANLPDFTPLVESNSPSVVNISTRIAPDQNAPDIDPRQAPTIPPGTPFDELFKRFFGEQGPMPRERRGQSLGSGFIISPDGYVLSNYHVIKGADEILVRLTDKREFIAKVVGTDERIDLALLKINATGLPVARLGNSSSLKVGGWVLAIGTPFGFDHSATAGIVSAIGRNLPYDSYVPFIQTDVAINPGNSGGPLINMDGQVVGINSQIYSRTGGYMGLSFAIPIEVAMEVVDQLKSQGRVTRAWLGVLIQDVTRELAESFGMKQPEGALIAQVMPDSPAQRAGIQVGDVITRFNDKAIENSADLPYLVGRSRVGSKAPVAVLREGKARTLTLTLAELPAEEATRTARAVPGAEPDNRLNLTVKDMTPEERQQSALKKGAVVVLQVNDGPAAEAGVRAGDIILSLNNTEIENTRQFTRAVQDLPTGKAVPLLVQRDRGALFLALKVQSNTGK